MTLKSRYAFGWWSCQPPGVATQGCNDALQAILNHRIPLSIGGGIGQSCTLMLLLRQAHLGEVRVTVWPKVLKDMGHAKNIHVLE